MRSSTKRYSIRLGFWKPISAGRASGDGRYQGRTPRGTPVYNVAFPVEKSSGRPYASSHLHEFVGIWHVD
jgi:hypothetical protein